MVDDGQLTGSGNGVEWVLRLGLLENLHGYPVEARFHLENVSVLKDHVGRAANHQRAWALNPVP